VTKDELLRTIRERREAVERIVSERDEAALIAPTLDEGWSIKDTLVHLAAWERRLLNATAAAERGEDDVWPEPGATIYDTHRLNDRDFAANRDRRLSDVLAESRQTSADFIAWAETFSDEQIAGELPYTPGLSLESIIRAQSDIHYQHHLDVIERCTANPPA
jgi:hypothetical protein